KACHIMAVTYVTQQACRRQGAGEWVVTVICWPPARLTLLDLKSGALWLRLWISVTNSSRECRRIPGCLSRSFMCSYPTTRERGTQAMLRARPSKSLPGNWAAILEPTWTLHFIDILTVTISQRCRLNDW